MTSSGVGKEKRQGNGDGKNGGQRIYALYIHSNGQKLKQRGQKGGTDGEKTSRDGLRHACQQHRILSFLILLVKRVLREAYTRPKKVHGPNSLSTSI